MDTRSVDAITLVAITVCLLYAFTRYVLGKGVPVDQMPLYVANKAAALAGLILFGAACVSRNKAARARFGERGLFLLVMHVLMTLVLLDPHYYAKMFRPDGRFTMAGGGAVVCGVLSLAYLLRIFCTYTLGIRRLRPAPGRVRAGSMVLLTAGLHVGLLGAPGWLTPSDWALGMPPLTLLGFVAALGFLVGPRAYRAVFAERRFRSPVNVAAGNRGVRSRGAAPIPRMTVAKPGHSACNSTSHDVQARDLWLSMLLGHRRLHRGRPGRR